MKWAKVISIGPYTFTVHFRPKVTGETGNDLYGEILYGEQTITVKSGLSDERTLTIIVHEVLHGIDNFMEIGLTEKQVLRLATGLTTVWAQNRAALLKMLRSEK